MSGYIIIWLITAIGSVLIHELGHIVFGLICKLSFDGILLFNKFISFKHTEKNNGIAFGVVMTVKNNISKIQFLLYYGGGIIFNLLFGILALIFIKNDFGFFFAILNITMGVLHLLPLPFDYYSDGMKIFRILNKNTSDCELLDFKLMSELCKNNTLDIMTLNKFKNSCQNDNFLFKYHWYCSVMDNCTNHTKKRLIHEQSLLKVNKAVRQNFQI